MYVEKIFLQNFKNHKELALNFNPKINFIAGANGSGKTNLLDAIHYISLTKSAFNHIDAHSINDNESFFAIKADLKDEEKNAYQILCSQAKNERKTIKVNKQLYEKTHQHIGRFPLVIITPFDNDLVREGSETRRKFIDTIICQIDQLYLQNLLQHNHILKQRNGLLKLHANKRNIDYALFEIYDEQLLPLAEQLFAKRKQFVTDFLPYFQDYYKLISEDKEIVEFEYKSQLSQPDWKTSYKAALEKDIVLGRTTIGTHKDDYIFKLNHQPLKIYGSQGQQKSYVIALKLANYEIIKTVKKFAPLLLLDDIFEKLDEGRISKLISIIAAPSFGQIFITDARIETSEKFFANYTQDLSIFIMKNTKPNGEEI